MQMADQTSSSESRPLILDSYLSKLTPDELAFFKSQTGIDDEEALKNHVADIQAEAVKVSCPSRAKSHAK